MDNVIIYDKLEELNEGIEYNGGGITSLLGKGVVKSVQRGETEVTALADEARDASIPIAAIDPSKAIVSTDYTVRGERGNGVQASEFAVKGLQSDSIVLRVRHKDNYSGGGIFTVYWQVTEFY